MGATDIEIVSQEKKTKKRVDINVQQYSDKNYQNVYKKLKRGCISLEDFKEYKNTLKEIKKHYPDISDIQQKFENTKIYKNIHNS